MLQNVQQSTLSMRDGGSSAGDMPRLRGVGSPVAQMSPGTQHQRTIGRREVLGAGLAGVLVALAPAGLARAATQKTTSRQAGRAAVPASALLTGYPQLYQQHALSCEAAAASMATRGRVTEQQILNQM